MSGCGRCGGVIKHINLKKPLDGAGGGHLNLKVKGQDGGYVFFRMKSCSTLGKLMNAYCDRQSVDPSSMAFLFDGRLLGPEQTPAELDMEDGDEIDAMLWEDGDEIDAMLYETGKWHSLAWIPSAHLFMIMLVLCTS